MPSSPRLHRAGPDDAARIARFHLRIWQQTYAGIAPPEAVRVLDQAHRLRQWQVTLANREPGHAVWLAEAGDAPGARARTGDGDRILGLVACRPPAAPIFQGLGEITYLYVDAGHRGQGLGRQMLDMAMTHLRDLGFEGVALAVVRQNRAARRFYRRLGGTETHHFSDPGPVWRSDDVLVVWRDGRLGDGPRLGWALPGDLPHLGAVVFDAVREGPSPYSQAQRAAWMPGPPDWRQRLHDQHVAIARQGDTILGLISLRADGYVDLAYIRPEARGLGLFGDLFAMIESRARELGLTALTTHASLMAQGPFLGQGFSILRRERVERAGQWLDRAEMGRDLA